MSSRKKVPPGSENAKAINLKKAKQVTIQFKKTNESIVDIPLPVLRQKEFTEYIINGIKLRFPFKAYGSQIGLMGKMIKSIINHENALLESPTGN